MLRIEYDDGEPIHSGKEQSKYCTSKGRSRGFYVIKEADEWHKEVEYMLPIGYMRVSEMKPLEIILNAMAVEVV